MKQRYALFIVPVLLVVLLPIPPKGGSVYNKMSGSLYCVSDGGCRHEIGHKMDDDLGQPSHLAEFGNAVMIHLLYAAKFGADDAARLILTQPGMLAYSDTFTIWGARRFTSPQSELYANLYELSNGDVSVLPGVFQQFFSKDTEYTQLHDCLMSARVKVCGRALHVEE